MKPAQKHAFFFVGREEGVLNDDNLSSSQLLNAFRITAAGWSLESAGDPDSKKRALAVVQSEIMMAD